MSCDHNSYMQKALDEAQEALHQNEFPVGCIMVYKGSIVANGRRQNSGRGETKSNELDHAEMLTLRDISQKHPDIDLSEVTVYSTMEPCLMCFSAMLISGIRNFVYAYEDAMGGGTNLPLLKLNPLYKEMIIKITPHILRAKSLSLFHQFFSSSETKYLKDTMLAQYTLNQKINQP